MIDRIGMSAILQKRTRTAVLFNWGIGVGKTITQSMMIPLSRKLIKNIINRQRNWWRFFWMVKRSWRRNRKCLCFCGLNDAPIPFSCPVCWITLPSRRKAWRCRSVLWRRFRAALGAAYCSFGSVETHLCHMRRIPGRRKLLGILQCSYGIGEASIIEQTISSP